MLEPWCEKSVEVVSTSYFLLPIRAISSALAAALDLMSWFLARSMRTLRMLVGTSRERAKRDPCWALFGTWEAGRGTRPCRSTVWCSSWINESSTPARFNMSIASVLLCVFSSRLARSGMFLWLRTHQGNSRAKQSQTCTLLIAGTGSEQWQKRDKTINAGGSQQETFRLNYAM